MENIFNKIGLFQGDAPQFIILGVAMAYQVFWYKFNNEIKHIGIKAELANIRISKILGNNFSAPLIKFFKFISYQAAFIFFSFTLFIILRIFLWYFLSGKYILIFDIIILLYFVFIAFYTFLATRWSEIIQHEIIDFPPFTNKKKFEIKERSYKQNNEQ